MIKFLIKKITPKSLLLFYHKCLAYLAAFFYGWPSRKMIVIGVTGTGGKSTVVSLIGRILEEAGYKVGWASTLNFKIAEKEWLNTLKMTMPGRFVLQKMLKQMLKAGCQYAIIETSSEGIVQSRHLGIDYDVAVFTNLTPEHIESHGSFEAYRAAKGELFKKLKIKNQKLKIIDGKEIKKVIVVNLADENAHYFLQFPADEYYGFAIKSVRMYTNDSQRIKKIIAENIKLNQNSSEFNINNSYFKISLLGQFNVENSLAAIAVALSQGINLEICQRALEKIKSIPGRLEIVIDKPFQVIVDYAHTPDSLEKVYQLLTSLKNPESKIIAVLGSAGGGRDKWKRPKLGALAAKYADDIIITNEDPYDEDPEEIIKQVAEGAKNTSLNQRKSLSIYEILDRKEAIKKVISLAKEGDIIIITGKGCEQWIMGPKGKKIPWDDRKVVREIFYDRDIPQK